MCPKFRSHFKSTRIILLLFFKSQTVQNMQSVILFCFTKQVKRGNYTDVTDESERSWLMTHIIWLTNVYGPCTRNVLSSISLHLQNFQLNHTDTTDIIIQQEIGCHITSSPILILFALLMLIADIWHKHKFLCICKLGTTFFYLVGILRGRKIPDYRFV